MKILKFLIASPIIVSFFILIWLGERVSISYAGSELRSPDADSVVISGELSGVISAGDYLVVGDISVAGEDSLVIQAGANFYFAGDYDFNIQGYLSAVGNEDDSIGFIPDINVPYWGGMVFDTVAVAGSELSYCYFTGASIGAISCYQSVITISHCSIINNSANWGGGIYLSTSDVEISACIVSGNSCLNNGGGIYCTHANPNIRDCIIRDNHCDGFGSGKGGGGVCFNHLSSGIMSGCTIYANSSGFYGGGVSCNDLSDAQISNCTISGNRADLWGGGMMLCWTYPTILNTIVDGNSGTCGVYLYGSIDASISYCDIYGNELGDISGDTLIPGLGQIVQVNANGDSCDAFHNLFADPMYVDAINGDFHLQEGSPCIDAGDPQSLFDPDSTIADIGAYFYYHIVRVNEEGKDLIPQFCLYPAEPNPFNSTTIIKFELQGLANVELIIYNSLGQEVNRLVDNVMQAGIYEVLWNGTNSAGHSVASGLYLLKMESRSIVTDVKYKAVSKLLLIR